MVILILSCHVYIHFMTCDDDELMIMVELDLYTEISPVSEMWERSVTFVHREVGKELACSGSQQKRTILVCHTISPSHSSLKSID